MKNYGIISTTFDCISSLFVILLPRFLCLILLSSCHKNPANLCLAYGL